jgi:AcrR family transcriptional regulator
VIERIIRLIDLPLRERKAGQTRIAIVRALLPRLNERPLEDIPVRELCAEVSISAPTLFNHFETKGAVLPYFVSLWSLGTASEMRQGSGEDDGIERIVRFFDSVGAAMKDHPGVLSAIIGHQHRLMALPERVEVGRAARLCWYGDGTETLALEPMTVPEMIGEGLALAAEQGAVPEGVDLPMVGSQLMALFYGVPAAQPTGKKAAALFRSAVQIVLKGNGLI